MEQLIFWVHSHGAAAAVIPPPVHALFHREHPAGEHAAMLRPSYHPQRQSSGPPEPEPGQRRGEGGGGRGGGGSGRAGGALGSL